MPPTSTPTLVPAWADNDSQSNPIASVVFEPLGTQDLIYSGDVSTPEGDLEDWLQFIPYQDMMYASLVCGETGNIQVSFLQSGQPVTLSFACGDQGKAIPVQAGTVYLIHIQAAQFSGGLQYLPYTVTIRMSP